MKKRGILSAILGAFALSGTTMAQTTQREPMAPKFVRTHNIKISKGLTQFFYGNATVWALNKKNADRKAKSLGYI